VWTQVPGQGEFSLNGPVTNNNNPTTFTQVGRIYDTTVDALLTTAWVNAAKAARNVTN